MRVSTKERISKIAQKWYLFEPLLFMVWTTHRVAINPSIKTLRTAKGVIQYNNSFIDNLSDAELYEVLAIEVIRIILKHPYSRKKEIASISYLSSNVTIKEYNPDFKNLPFAEDLFKTEEFNKKNFEFYYYKLLSEANQNSSAENENDKEENDKEENEEKNEASSSESENNEDENEEKNDSSSENKKDKEGNEEKNDSSSTRSENENNDNGNENDENDQNTESENTLSQYFDSESSGTENAAAWGEDEFINNQINQKIEAAIETNSWGKLTNNFQEQIIASLKPKINYRSVLKAFRASVLSSNRTLTRMKPSRRYGFQFMGSRRDFTTKLLVAVDVSGSVDSHDLAKAFSIINHFFKYGVQTIDVVQFDTEIKGEKQSLKKAIQKINIIGRGGTCFEPVIQYIEKDRTYDGLIIYTDGYAPTPSIPKNKHTRVLWLFNTEENYNALKDSFAKIGKSVFVQE